jgi:hypothetical protein
VLYQSNFDRVFQVYGESMDVLRTAGAVDEIRRLYMQVRTHIEDMPEGFWRKHYLTRLKTTWGHLVGDAVKPAAPGPGPTGVVGSDAPVRRKMAGVNFRGDD